MAEAKRDSNRIPTLLGVSSVDGVTPVNVYVDPVTHRLLIDSATVGTVTSVSVVTANGVSGSVATATSTPAITLTLGAITPSSVNKVTITAPATSATLTIANGKTLTVNNTITFTATDGSTLAIGAGGTLGSAAYTASTAYAASTHASTHAVGGADSVFPADPGADKYLKFNNTSNAIEWADVAGGGDVTGPASSTADAIVLFNGLTGKIIKDSTKTIVTTLGADDTTVPTSKAVKDVTDSLVTKALFDANSILIATTDNTPLALTVGASTIVGRKSSGDIVALTATETRSIINVADGATANTKASASDLDTGTDDTKFATALAIKDSHNIPSVAPGTSGNVLTSNGTDWTSAAPAGGGGDWTELANVTLASAATSLASGTITGKQALKIIIHVVNLAASDNIRINFNSDTGNNYGYRDFATFSTSNAVSDWSYMPLTMSTTSTSIMIVIDIFNKSDVRKPVIVSSTICGANSATPNSYDVKGVWNNTSAQITSVTISTSAQNMGAGTRMLVYGSKS